jgi:hypothetical protein
LRRKPVKNVLTFESSKFLLQSRRKYQAEKAHFDGARHGRTSLRRPAGVFTNALVLGAMIILAPRVGAQAQDGGEEGPIEIAKCQTIDKPGSYKLVKNLAFTGTSGTCLSVTASFVTIDLAGFTITVQLPAGLSATAIAAVPPSGGQLLGIAVRNGSISNFRIGVDLSTSADSIVEQLRVDGDGSPQGVTSGSGILADGIVKGNIVSNSATGIATNGTVTGNVVIGLTVGLSAGPGSTVIGNTITNAEVQGLVVSCPSNVTDNTSVNNVPNGMNLVLNGEGCSNTNNVAP